MCRDMPGDYFAEDTILINWFSRLNITMQGDGMFPRHLAGKSPAFVNAFMILFLSDPSPIIGYACH